MIVVADTSPLSNLAAIGHLELLRLLFAQVIVPEFVARELRAGEQRGAHPAFLDDEDWIVVRPASNRELVRELSAMLDAGEAEAIALSEELRADLLLIDERAGREAAARRGLQSVGLLGTLIAAKSRGLVPTVGPLLDALRDEAGFWMREELYERVLRQAGEID